MMFRKGDCMEKRLKKIVKGEAASLKLLEKQQAELERALDENNRLLEERLSKQNPAEAKLSREAEKLRKKLDQLTLELNEFQERREKAVEPLRQRDGELNEKLRLVKMQLDSLRGMRGRSLSVTTLDVSPGAGTVAFFSQSSSSSLYSPTSPHNLASAPLAPLDADWNDPPPYSESAKQ